MLPTSFFIINIRLLKKLKELVIYLPNIIDTFEKK